MTPKCLLLLLCLYMFAVAFFSLVSGTVWYRGRISTAFNVVLLWSTELIMQ